jgi:hypothetical protein
MSQLFAVAPPSARSSSSGVPMAVFCARTASTV